MNLTFNYNLLLTIYNAIGAEGLLQLFNSIYGNNFYSISEDWIYNSEYICKLKGENGDLIISWE